MSTGSVALALALAGVGLVVMPHRGPLTVGGPRRARDPRLRRALLAGAGAGAAGTLLGLPWWCDLAVGGAAACAVRLAAGRRRGPSLPEMREIAAVLDLVAVCLDAGLTVPRALGAALPAGGPDGSGPATDQRRVDADARAEPDALGALVEVRALLALGADPATAWLPAARHDLLGALASAAERSALGGVRLADAARESAAEIRERCRRVGVRHAGRASVVITAPLTLCFLPAFVCLGLAPVIVSLVSTLNIW